MDIGYEYIFALKFSCNNNSPCICDPNCNKINIKYEYNDIICQINGGSQINILNINLNEIKNNNFKLLLDGYSYTNAPNPNNHICIAIIIKIVIIYL